MNKIRLFWWSEKYFHKSVTENYGDLLGKYLVEKISKKKVIFSVPKKRSWRDLFAPIYMTIGSVLTNVNDKCIVWGSGIIDKESSIKNATFLAVRGPQTRAYLLKNGYNVPEIYGDPGLLLPDFYQPNIKKKYTFGIVPHVNDYGEIEKMYKHRTNIQVINLHTNDIELTTNQILECERIISSSLHGLIIAHAYRIPAIWQQFSNKLFGDGVKFQDYFESVNMEFYKPNITLRVLGEKEMNDLFETYTYLPKQEKVESLKKGLMQSCPFI